MTWQFLEAGATVKEERQASLLADGGSGLPRRGSAPWSEDGNWGLRRSVIPSSHAPTAMTEE